jgi:Xaa-Pro aminopeptidase
MPPALRPLLRRYSQVFPVGNAGTRAPEILKRRRRRHLDALDSFAIFAGVPHEPGSENLWLMNGLRIFQEPALIHLCGVNQPRIRLALIPGGKPQEILFVPEKDPAREFWDGVRFGYPSGIGYPARKKAEKSGDLEDIRRLTGIEDIRPLGEFEAWLQALLRRWKQPFGYAFFHEYRDPGRRGALRVLRSDHNFAFKRELQRLARGHRKGFAIRSCASLHFRLRLPLEDAQVRDVDKAVAVTRAAFLDTLSAWKTLRDENALAAHLEYGMRRRSPFGLSFPCIVAGGRNATVLHYLKNDEPLLPGSMVLIDFGARYGTMHADISRTLPVSGRFNPLQELLYGVVLDAAKFNQRNARPGATIRQMSESVWAYLEDALQERFFARGGKAVRAYSKKPHGVSHLMGEQEHDGDPYKIYQDEPLREGWQISNEPGLYGRFAITLKGRRYAEWIGIRIEDDLLVTRGGCRNLSASIPRECGELENLMRRSG